MVLRTQITRVGDAVSQQSNEVITLKKMVRSFGHQLQKARQQTRQHMRHIDEKIRLNEMLKEEEEILAGKLRKFTDLNATAQDRLNSLDELFEVNFGMASFPIFLEF